VFASLPGVPRGFTGTTAAQRDNVWGGAGSWTTGSPSIGTATYVVQDAGQGATVEDLSAGGAKRVSYAAIANRYDITRGVSAAVLMRPRATYSAGQPFLSKATAFGAGTEDWIIGAEAGALYYWQIADSGGAETFVDSTTAQSTGRTDLVVGTYDGANIRIYVNGKLEGTAATTLTVANNAAIPIAFGPFTTGSEILIDFFMGAVWRRPLSAQEIGRLYADPYALWRPTARAGSIGFAPQDAALNAGLLLGM
jgi:hypothetical protein